MELDVKADSEAVEKLADLKVLHCLYHYRSQPRLRFQLHLVHHLLNRQVQSVLMAIAGAIPQLGQRA